MTIKNYTATVSTNRSISEIQYTFVMQGFYGLLYKYEQGTVRIEALQCL